MRSACASEGALPTLAADQVLHRDAKRLSAELLQRASDVPLSVRPARAGLCQGKLDFFVSCRGDVQFEYDVPADIVIIADQSRPRQQRTILNVHEPDSLRLLRPADIARPEPPSRPQRPRTMSFRSARCLLPVGHEQHWHNIRMRTLWSPFSPGHYVGVIGCLTDTQKVQDSCAPFRCTDKAQRTSCRSPMIYSV